MAERTTVRLPEELVRRAKIRAAEEGRTLTSLIEDGLRMVLAGKNKAAKRKRVQIPVSSAKGGLMPGIDLDDGSAIQEMYDLEYAERMKRFK